ncbi:hypothetical protein DPMN_143414 [Dreissena polymorpha]|uniref:Uncharacterized protein n=1 Tax=Dreissena polymorpha TaxID=45954 RepID=A0A9D4JPB1_DREPO|nr:hypothetical protein DPMN_143414 [Dreissena polymorpha]
MCVPQSQTSNPFQKSTTKTNTCVSWPAALRCRVRIELERLRKQSCSDELFLRSAKFAIENIMHCFSGDHKMCKERSRVCTYRVTSSYKHLPYGDH